MIYGIGTDLVDLDRIKNMKSLSAFANKILGDQELEQYSDMPEGAQSILSWQAICCQGSFR
jgi:phosphopantetheinyl transferase (holo-ACP synthase)